MGEIPGFQGVWATHETLEGCRQELRIIPNPHGGDIGVDLLRRILRQAGISREEWLDAE